VGLANQSYGLALPCWKKSSDQLIADEAQVVASASENHANVGACEVVPFK
jgi:hypothetical protein